MEPRDYIAILFVIIVLISCVYTIRQGSKPDIMAKKLNNDSISDDTESERDLHQNAEQKEVDKMDLIPEESDVKDAGKEDNMKADDRKSDDLSDSEEYSMKRMDEEYRKSRTLKKKVSEIMEDITDSFKRRKIQIKRKLEGPVPPAVVVPMSIKEKMAIINAQKKKKKSKGNIEKKSEKQRQPKIPQKQEKDEEFGDFVKFDEADIDGKELRHNDSDAVEIISPVSNEKRDIVIDIEEEKVKEENQLVHDDVGDEAEAEQLVPLDAQNA